MFNDALLNETEQDANTMLAELDKGLRSTKQGVQCEAIVRFPRLFEKYPFPILINSSFLKLSEFFLNGPNLLRFWIFRVCRQSEYHLDKILSLDVFVKRIFMVMYANDAVARSLTLRTLGALSRVISEKQQVHHAIRRALDSRDAVEVEAAIEASEKFASQSRSFAISMCSKIADLIESLQVPIKIKLLLIPILRHMHHDSDSASMVKELCLNLLKRYPAENFVVAILDSLTQLTTHTLTNVHSQVDLLLQFLCDSRKAVRMQALKSLILLCDPDCVHAWPKSVITDLVHKAKTCIDPHEQYLHLTIILKYTYCPLSCHSLLHDREKKFAVMELCRNCVCLDDYATASQAMSILASLVVYAAQEDISEEIMEVVNLHMEGLLISTACGEQHSQSLRTVLTCGIQMANVKPDFRFEFVTMVANLLSDDVEYPLINAEMMCDTLGALGSQLQLKRFNTQPYDKDAMEIDEPNIVKVNTVNPVIERLPLILHKLNAMIDNGTTQSNSHLIEILTAVTLQSLLGFYVPKDIIDCLNRCSDQVNAWTQLRMARSACRYGQHFLAAQIYSKISRNTIVDKPHFFLVGMAQITQAECILNYGATNEKLAEHYTQYEPRLLAEGKSPMKPMSLIQRLEAATKLYWQSLANVRACSSPVHPLHFQLEFIKLRAQFLQTLLLAVTVKNAHIIVPPPAIAGSIAQNSRDYLQKYGHVTNQLRKLVKALKTCQESYTRLFKTSFDADPTTLEFLEIAEYQCALLSYIVESISFVNCSDQPTLRTKGTFPETCYFASRCRKMEELMKFLPKEQENVKHIGNRHLEVIMAEVEHIVRSPMPIPRYFFQTLQSTQIKLSVSPQPRIAGEPVIVQAGSNLVVKVEGVVLYSGKKRGHFRSIDSVLLTLTAQLMQPRTPNDVNSVSKTPPNDALVLTQTVKPHRDFLTGNFLVSISNGGQWTVALEAFVIDGDGITWCTGPRNSMLVRVLDDPTKPTSSSSSTQSRRF